jgi:NADPH:quinone reductase
MKAAFCNQWGQPEVISFGTAQEPKPGRNDVLIAPAAWGVNFADLVQISGTYHLKPPFPFIPGMEVAGRVIAIGDGVERLRIGDRVASYVESGGYAERVVAMAAATMTLPCSMPFEQGAAFSVAYVTAHIALRHRANLQPGGTLLILGAAGGVGLAAVELGRALEATVIAGVSTDAKAHIAQQHGAHHTVNYLSGSLREEVMDLTKGRGVDVVLDPVGGDVFDAGLKCLAFEGCAIVIGFASGRIPIVSAGRLLVKGTGIMGSSLTFTLKHRSEILPATYQELCNWYSQGKLRPHVSQILPFSSLRQGLRMLANREITGKIVLIADPVTAGPVTN